MKLSNQLLSILLCLAVIKSNAQTAFTGDQFGGRLWYQPTNFSVGSYSAHTVCGETNQLYSWGTNVHGELGYKEWSSKIQPTKVEGMDSVYYYSAGYVAGAVKRDGSGWVWGGQFAQPTKVMNAAVYVDAGEHAVCFIKSDGTVWSVGQAIRGSFGNGEVTFYSTSAVKMDYIDDAVRIANGYDVTLVLRADGTVWACGDNRNFGLGELNQKLIKLKPSPIKALKNIVAIASSRFVNLALDHKGDVFVWGYGHGNWQTSVRKVEGLENIVAISARNDGAHLMALDSKGNCYAWGHNYYGQLGTGTDASQSKPILVAKDVIDILAGESFSYIVKKDQSLWATGSSKGGSIWLSESNTKKLVYTKISLENSDLPCYIHFSDFSNYSAETINLCQGDAYIYHDSAVYQTVTFKEVYRNYFGFDSTHLIHVVFNPVTHSTQSLAFCPYDNSPRFGSPIQRGIYYDSLQNAMGCDSIVHIHVKYKMHYSCDVPRCFIPTAFTPNDDGLNEEFTFKGTDIVQAGLAIYNRWGQLEYEETAVHPSWNGQGKMGPVDPGIYSYIIQTLYKTGNEKTYYGTVHLIR